MIHDRLPREALLMEAYESLDEYIQTGSEKALEEMRAVCCFLTADAVHQIAHDVAKAVAR